MLGCQCRHEFLDSYSWTASTNVPPEELHWPPCTYWRLCWCRMLRVPVLVQLCRCCQFVVNWYGMPCHTQYIHNLAWGEQWSGTASVVCLCPLPTSSVQTLGWDWEPPCTESLAHWCASWRRGANPTTAQGIVLTPQLERVCRWSWLWGISGLCFGVQWNAQLYIYGLQTWNRSLLPIPVRHLLPAVDVFLWCQGSAHENRLPDHQQEVHGNERWQLINLQSKTCKSQDTTSWNTFFLVEFIRECVSDSDPNSAVPEILRLENRQSASEANPM